MKQVLLVEGRDDQHVIWALCKKFELPENFEIKAVDGIDSLLEQLPVWLKAAGISTIGIVIDADVNMKHRWDAVKGILKRKYPQFPEEAGRHGTVFQEGGSKLGVWLMPDNQMSGMLETFIEFLIPMDDDLRSVINAHLDDIERENRNRYRLIHRDKAFIHAWLAVQEDPGTPMGLSITKKYLTTDSEQCQHFMNWLSKLYN